MEMFLVAIAAIAAIVTIITGAIVFYEWLQTKRFRD